MNHFPANLRATMDRRGVSAVGVSAGSGIHLRRLKRLRAGQVEVRLDEVFVLSEVLRVEPQHLAWMDPEAFARQGFSPWKKPA